MNPRAMLLPQLIRYRAEESGDRVFLRRVEGGEMSYCDYHVQALEWAWAFERVGVAAQDRVACMLPNGFDIPLAWLGCAWLKAQLAVINPAYRGRMLEDVLTTIGARIFVISRHYLDQLDGIDLTRTGIGMLIVVDEDAPQVAGIEAIGRAAFLAGATPQPREGPEPHDVACIIFTSGTTGPSKAVMVHWGQLNATSTDRTGLEMGPDDVWYSPLPMFHLTGFGPIYKMAMVGGSVVIRQLLSLKDYFTDIEAFGATGAVLMESMILMLMRQSETDFVKPPLLRQVITVPVPAHIDAFREKFGVAVATMYNMTELGTPLASDGYDVDASYTGSCGRLREDLYEARIVDPLDYPVEDGAVGELILRPKKPWTITTAYFNNPAGTAEAWRNGWFHTGDAFRRDAEGRYFFVDRLKDAIRRRGENISSAEVERDVAAHPCVREVAAVPQKSDDGQEEVKVFIVLKEGETFDPAAMVDFLVPRMPHFMVPRYFEAVETLPRTPSQKIQKHLLRAMGNSAATWDREAAGIILRAKRY